MSGVVTDPGDELGLKLILIVTDEVEHALECFVRNVTVVVSPPASKTNIAASVFVEAVPAATNGIITNCIGKL